MELSDIFCSPDRQFKHDRLSGLCGSIDEHSFPLDDQVILGFTADVRYWWTYIGDRLPPAVTMGEIEGHAALFIQDVGDFKSISYPSDYDYWSDVGSIGNLREW